MKNAATQPKSSSGSEWLVSFSLLLRRLEGTRFSLLLIAGVSLLVHLPNLLNYPAWFFDEGAYLTFSSQWLQTGKLSYYGHPFGALAILTVMFATVNPTTYLYPRIFMVALSLIDGMLLYKITNAVYKRNDGFALVTALLYVATPLSARYLRLVVVDNFMAFFLLLSLLVLVTRKGDRFLSALLFGAAIVSKQTGLFFIPAVVILLGREKRSIAGIVLWFAIVAIIPLLWALFGISQIGLSNFISSQFALTGLGGERAVNAARLILDRITTRDPFVFVGLAGVFWAFYKRDFLVAFPFSYLLAFVVLFLKVSTVYLIPVLPFFSILAAVLLFDLWDKVPRLKSLPQLKKTLFAILVIVLVGSSLFLVAFQNPSVPQSDAMSYVVARHPSGIVVSYTYLWLIRQNYPSLANITYDRYGNWTALRGKAVYLIVDYPGDLTTINAIQAYHDLYYANATQQTLKTFKDTASGYIVQVLNGTVP